VRRKKEREGEPVEMGFEEDDFVLFDGTARKYIMSHLLNSEP
jgi:hypothetical protein